MSEKLLEFTDYSFSIASKILLDKIALNLETPKLLGILGANGAGKSTLLRSLCGLLPAEGKSSGIIRLKGVDPAKLASKARGRLVSYMRQDTALAYAFKALDLVKTGRYPYLKPFQGFSKEDITAVEEALVQSHTLEFADRDVRRLSGGERQRLVFARVLAQDSPVVLLDEPSANLDLARQEEIFLGAKNLVAQGKVVLVAVHDLRLAARFCDHLALLHEGRLLASGKPEAVMTAANLSTAYQTPVKVYRNTITGFLDFHVYRENPEKGLLRIHVIGGGGSASGVLRLLGERGLHLSAGVLAPGDSDLQSASLYGVSVVTSKPFSAIGDAAFHETCELCAQADLTILCSLCWGKQNLRNLEAAKFSQELLILEDEAPETRDFCDGAGLPLYRELQAQGTCIPGKAFPAFLDSWLSSHEA